MIQIFINENYANGHKIYSFMKIVGIWNLLSFLWWIWVCYEYNTIKWRREYLFMLIMSSCWMLSNVKSLFMEMRKILPPSILRNLLKSEFDSFEKFLWTWIVKFLFETNSTDENPFYSQALKVYDFYDFNSFLIQHQWKITENWNFSAKKPKNS